ncbi:DNA cytosine methyltransferase [Sinirhodobacter populi]|uniref:DNA (cytosine-5-)-methyltransferase n=2 Tax=Paenirhodobacter populi TaxID=2306993 RepID=A0A443JY58_9RHOB|nr:DNA cytosine methyltransferase [Sinirhodobacter populi]
MAQELRPDLIENRIHNRTAAQNAGLGGGWECVYANDCDRLKQSSYAANWDGGHFDPRDVAEVTAADLGGLADLAWASFPCQDLSQAGSKAGIGASEGSVSTRSGAVWPFLSIIGQLRAEGRHPAILALENVVGLLSSNGGADFRALCASLSENGYRFGAIVADAAHFVPQSRPSVFIIAVRREVPIPESLLTEMGKGPWHPQILLRSRAPLPSADSENWLWWSPGDPPHSKQFELEDIIDLSDRAEWNSDETTDRLLGMMSDAHRDRLAAAKVAGHPMIGSLYLRMRPNGKAGNIQRAEIAFGSTLGCLRTSRVRTRSGVIARR